MMKRILLFLLAVITVTTAFTQTSTQINFSSLEKKIERSNSHIEHDRRSERYRTWLSRAELMLEVHDAMMLNATSGMGLGEFSIIVGTPNEQSEKEVDGNIITEYVMDRVTFYFVNGVLEYWKFTDPLFENPLEEALRSFKKTMELDERGRAEDNIREGLFRLKYIYIAEGSSCYTQMDYTCAYDMFVKSIDIGENPIVNHVDTLIIYYTGLSAQLAEKYDEAIEYYKKAIDYNETQNGNVYYNIYEAYTKQEKENEGLKYLEDGFLEHPSNQNILFGLINYYINKGDSPDLVLNYIDKAIETEPENYSLYFAKGTVHENLDDFEGAYESYSKSIELNPEFFDALFNLGALFFNKGVQYLEEANKVPAREVEKYDELIEKSNKEFRKSIPYLERAYELSPESKATIETLRNLYFRFRNDGPEMQEKYDEFDEKWKGFE